MMDTIPLEWIEGSDSFGRPKWAGVSPVLEYRIFTYGPTSFELRTFMKGTFESEKHKSFEEAKSAAESHWTERMKQCLIKVS